MTKKQLEKYFEKSSSYVFFIDDMVRVDGTFTIEELEKIFKCMKGE